MICITGYKPHIISAIFSIIACLIFLGGCASTHNTDKRWGSGISSSLSEKLALMGDTRPLNGKPVFFAASSRYLEREREEEICLDRAASQAAKYFYLKGRAELLQEKTTGKIGYLQEMDIYYNKELIPVLRKHLKILDKVQDESGTYIRAQLDGEISLHIPWEPKALPGKTPRWITGTPDIPGYHSAVGVAHRMRLFPDSVEAADRKALESLLGSISMKIKSIQDRITVDTLGTAQRTTSIEVAEADMEGFYILSRWISPDGRYFYSLAVCKR